MIKYFYCEVCGTIYSAKCKDVAKTIISDDENISYDISYWYKCEPCSNLAVEIDPGMVMIIQKINKTKLKTVYCCEGHYDEGPTIQSYILFDDSVSMEIFNEIIGKVQLPKDWTISNNDTYGRVCLEHILENFDDKINEAMFNVLKTQYLSDLEKWVDDVIRLCSDIV